MSRFRVSSVMIHVVDCSVEKYEAIVKLIASLFPCCSHVPICSIYSGVYFQLCHLRLRIWQFRSIVKCAMLRLQSGPPL